MVSWQDFFEKKEEFLKFSNDILEIIEKKDVFCSSPYVPGLSEKLERILQNNGLKVALGGSDTLASFFKFWKVLKFRRATKWGL